MYVRFRTIDLLRRKPRLYQLNYRIQSNIHSWGDILYNVVTMTITMQIIMMSRRYTHYTDIYTLYKYYLSVDISIVPSSGVLLNILLSGLVCLLLGHERPEHTWFVPKTANMHLSCSHGNAILPIDLHLPPEFSHCE